MKVLWLSNIAFSSQKLKATASWLQPMAEQLAKSVEMVNVSDGQVNKPTVSTLNKIKQWVIPFHATCYGQEASEETCLQVQRIIDEEKPDLVHLWGTEKYWASIYRKGYIHVPTILDIQGLLAPYTDYYYGGLSWKEIIKSIHLKEVLMPWRTLFHKREVFRKRGICETRNIKSFKYIAYQSQWVKNYLSYTHPSALLFPTKIILRKGFYESENGDIKN